MEHFISSGNKALDSLCKGIERDAVTTVYGPAGCGKTNFCILACVDVIKNGKKVIYIDTDGSFSVERLRQIVEAKDMDLKETLSQMTFYKPINFKEQQSVFEKLRTGVNDAVGLIVVDSIAMLYRLELGKNADEVYGINRDLGRQIAYLCEISRKKNIPVFLTNQVYSSFDALNKDRVQMVGGDILKYSSKCLIELKSYRNVRKAILKRHRSLPADKEVVFKIIEEGVEMFDENSMDRIADEKPAPSINRSHKSSLFSNC